MPHFVYMVLLSLCFACDWAESMQLLDNSASSEAEALEKAGRAWTRLGEYKSKSSLHKAESPLPVRALEDAEDAVKLHNAPHTRAIHALTRVAASRWALATSWDSIAFNDDLKVVEEAALDATGEAKVALALLLLHGCSGSEHTQCVGADTALLAARAALPSKPDWLDGELTWAETRFWATKVARHKRDGDERTAGEARKKVLEICTSAAISQRTRSATGALTMTECVHAAAESQRYGLWLNGVRWFVQRDIQDSGTLLPWVVEFANQSSSQRCRGMRTTMDRTTGQQVPRIENKSDAVCASYGFVALGCFNQMSVVINRWQLGFTHEAEIRAIAKATSIASSIRAIEKATWGASPHKLSCYLDGAVPLSGDQSGG